MAGLFGFGSKNEEVFLSDDDAKTMGDIDFMRKKVSIKRTFPKIQGGKGAEIVKEVSSLNNNVSKERQFGNSSSFSISKAQETTKTTESTSETTPTVQNNRGVDSSMDMFRNMAKGMKK